MNLFESAELKKELRDIKKLLVLQLIKNDVGQDEIARVLGVSQPAVSQMVNPKGPMVIAELIVSTGDAMGANAVNTMAEAIAPLVSQITGGRVYLRIISNLADRRLVRVSATFDKEALKELT